MRGPPDRWGCAPPARREALHAGREASSSTGMRFAAGDLPPRETAAFEVRLAGEQSARDALAEAVRLSAAALGQDAPAPDRTFRAMIRERLLRSWYPGWLARRAYRGHPLAWAGAGAAIV